MMLFLKLKKYSIDLKNSISYDPIAARWKLYSANLRQKDELIKESDLRANWLLRTTTSNYICFFSLHSAATLILYNSGTN